MLNFKEWKFWLKNLPQSKKWFAWLILLRPVIDSFYFLKKISPLLSPLYIVGILTPVLVIYNYNKLNKQMRNASDTIFTGLAIIVSCSTFLIYAYDPTSIESLQYALKLSFFIFIFYFARRFIESRHDIEMILQTFIYSTFYVSIILMYEVFINPFKVSYSRELTRIQGVFADVTNYGFYATISFLCITYFITTRRHKMSTRSIILWIVASLAFSLTVLVKINHMASWGVFLALGGLFLFNNIQVNKVAGLVFVAFVSLIVFAFFGDLIIERIYPLIETDLQVIDGEKEAGRFAHGRLSRWEFMFDMYFNFHPFAQAFGMPFTLEFSAPFCGTGSHNDFVRFLFFTGFMGVFLYALFLISIFIRSLRAAATSQYLIFGSLIIVFLYSLTTNPTCYAPVMYIVLCIFSFCLLPIHIRDK